MKKSLTILLSLISLSSLAADYGDLTDEEQVLLELTNYARAHPFESAKKLGIDVNEGLPDGTITNNPKQPLASDASAYKAAKDHCLDMMANNYWDHVSLDGRQFWNRMANAGYLGNPVGENISSTGDGQYSYELFYVDNGVDSKGHRTNMLNDRSTDAGFGGCEYFVEDFGSSYQPVITGVIYDDKNGDKFYSKGEGIGEVTITIGNKSSKSVRSGGYRIDATGNVTVTFTHPTAGSITKNVQVSNKNVKVDVLMTEFSNATSVPPVADGIINRYCATFDNSNLNIQCLNYYGTNYNVNLRYSGNNFIVSEVNKVLVLDPYNTGKASAICSTYNTTSKVINIPCVLYNNTSLNVNLSEQGNHFNLLNYSINQ
jgi:uncharacterized protein YkwD